jgi:hypothetical protein
VGLECPQLHAAWEESDSFRAYFRGYQSANRYWDAPDGLRYWRGRYEIDRGQPDGSGLRLVDEGAKPIKDWDGPPYAPNGIGLYYLDDKGRWWPTEAALASGYMPCSSCEQTNRKSAIAASPKDPQRVAAFIAEAASELGRSLNREELARVLRQYPDRAGGPSMQSDDRRTELGGGPDNLFAPETKRERDVGSRDVPKAQVVRKLLELRAREAPLGSTGYRGVLTQQAIAIVARVRVRDVTQAAIALDAEMKAAKAKEAE